MYEHVYYGWVLIECFKNADYIGGIGGKLKIELSVEDC